MKKFAMIALVVVLGVSALYACGGMSPAPAPADTNTAVPDLPTDASSTTNDLPNGSGNDNTNGGSDNTGNNDTNNTSCKDGAKNTVDGTGLSLEDKSTLKDLNNLSTDLPCGKNSSSSDGNFVSCVL